MKSVDDYIPFGIIFIEYKDGRIKISSTDNSAILNPPRTDPRVLPKLKSTIDAGPHKELLSRLFCKRVTHGQLNDYIQIAEIIFGYIIGKPIILTKYARFAILPQHLYEKVEAGIRANNPDMTTKYPDYFTDTNGMTIDSQMIILREMSGAELLQVIVHEVGHVFSKNSVRLAKPKRAHRRERGSPKAKELYAYLYQILAVDLINDMCKQHKIKHTVPVRKSEDYNSAVHKNAMAKAISYFSKNKPAI